MQPDMKRMGIVSASVEDFTYPGIAEVELPGWTLWEASDAAGETAIPVPFTPQTGNKDRGTLPQRAASPAEWETRLAQEAQSSFAAGQRQGIEDGRRAEQEAQFALRSKVEREHAATLARAVGGFDEEKGRFFADAEREVVRLALAVAARILRHESTVDPLILTGAVRVALGQLQAASEVRLRVPACDFELWTETVEHLPGLAMRPRVVADEGMQTGDCAVEADLGRADLGIQAQLSEIERMILTGGDGGPA